MLAALGWVIALGSVGLAAWVEWKRSVEKERVRRDVEQEQAEIAAEAKRREAKILAMPNDPKADVIRKMRENRDRSE